MSKRLFLKSEVGAKGKGWDSVRARRVSEGKGKAVGLLYRARRAWENLSKVREVRQRVMNYCYGDQWGDLIEWKDEKMTEREYISRIGNIPLTNNIMVSILNTVVGLYAKQSTEPVCFARTHDSQWLSDMMSATMQQNWQLTSMPDVLKTVFEDNLLGGVSMVRESFEQRDEVLDSWTDYVNPNYGFWEGGSDPRYKDFRMVGMLHDMSRSELYKMFANKEYGWTPAKLDEVFSATAPADLRNYTNIGNGYGEGVDGDWGGGLEQNERHDLENVNFFHCNDKRLFRVIEVWTKESKRRLQCHDPISESADGALYRVELSERGRIEAINAQREIMYAKAGVSSDEVPLILMEEIQDEFWYYTYLSPDGTILCEGESPFDFNSHPFTIKLYPYVNGEIHPFMGNVIDQQRYINRLIVMHDMAARTSAKGLTIVPSDSIPKGMTPRDFADQFTSYDGLVIYDTSRKNPNLRPEIISGNAVQIGTTELLNMEISLVRDITNVSGAIQGKTPTSGTSAARYNLETQNSTTALYTVFADMTSFVEELARKKCSFIKQFYPERRYILNKDQTGLVEFDRMSVEDVMFKISVKESAATAAYQMQVNDTLKELLSMGLISVTQYLQNCNLPFADGLLQQIISEQQAQAAAMEEQQAQQEQ